jgi:hypothetical protein
MSRSRREVATSHQRIDVALSGDLLDVAPQQMGRCRGRVRATADSLSSVRAANGLDITGHAARDTSTAIATPSRVPSNRAARGALIMASKSKPGWGSWLVLVVLIGLLCLAIVVLYVSWDPEQSGAMTGAGYVAMVLGIIATLALGVGLMALMYYSNRSGRD